MRKGLTLALMTVAITLISVRAMALAPTIFDIPSPIVGNAESATGANMFVFPDAFDITQYAADDITSSSNLLWTYTQASPGVYLINGVTTVSAAVGGDNLVAPTATKVINNNVISPELNPDSAFYNNKRTVTIRNKKLSPLGGSTSTTVGVPLLQYSDILPITFFVSDGTNFSTSRPVLFYTYYGGHDSLSGSVWKNEKSANDLPLWTYKDGPFGNISKGTDSTNNSICMTTGLTGENFASVGTGMGYFTLSQNSVYRIRLKMNFSQGNIGRTPFWDFIVENFDGLTGDNMYGMDQYNFDTEPPATGQSGRNAIISTSGGTWVTLYWTPAAVRSATWSAMFSDPTRDAGRKPRLRFRILDVDSNAATAANTKDGTLCLQALTIESQPLNNMRVVSVLQNLSTFVRTIMGSGNPIVPGQNVRIENLVGTTISIVGGVIQLTPTGAGQTNEIVTITPATANAPEVPNTWNTYIDKYPIPWTSNKILAFEVTLSAPDTTKPWDVIWMNMEAPDNELNGESFVTSNKGNGAPTATASPTTFIMLYSTGNETGSLVPVFHNLRWRLRFGNGAALLFPSGGATNTGRVDITNIKVSEVRF